ncbi:type VI secretion system baseplate subunit TssF [Jannaschia aquimarina]|uniref:Type VI secretion protein n=1 Tax=Jannaschia aquimarina TaxID=935700 RepID=A0A0D1CT13_9RHOB|nr:type VI secretion system baseplate subunit TssF [Jannaschia aquimarina]KIT17902.1 hypothetical protein jaqu_03270 [Jannaschia aquimarina]SNT23483.1 type VI secretion system protein ImpG [Jannaschia aquimarina]
MRKAFRDAYERELALLYERAAEFATDYPGIAGRLGGVLRDNADPAVAGLLEGAAFMAARVQLKLDQEFRVFTDELLEQVFPDALAPIPSMMLVEAALPADATDMAEGLPISKGAYMDARFVDADRRVSCRFRTATPLRIYPMRLAGCAYRANAAEISALGQDAGDGVVAGVTVDFETIGDVPAATLDLDDLAIHLTGAMADAVALYEQILCDTVRVSLRWLDASGDAAFLRLPVEAIGQVGLDRDERILPHDARLFDGFALLREGFAFPRQFLGFRLSGLRRALRAVHGQSFQIVLEFDRLDADLAARLTPEDLAIHCVPAVNLFVEQAAQVRLDGKRTEFVVTPASTPVTHYEVHRILDVHAHYATTKTKRRVYPLYGLSGTGGEDPRAALYYTTRRKERRLTDEERRFGRRHRYLGTETFISLWEPPDLDDGEDDARGGGASRLQVRTLCSNRHLPEYLPVAKARDAFVLDDDQTIALRCVVGPTAPREPLSLLDRNASHRTIQGDVHWRLISYLSLSQFGIEGHGGDTDAIALREMLSLFADLSDATDERQIGGVLELATRAVTRLIRREDGHFPARGTEIRLVLDDEAFEGSGPILMGAILDRFFAEYAPVNSFTQTVIETRQRGEIKTFPPRSGTGPLL